MSHQLPYVPATRENVYRIKKHKYGTPPFHPPDWQYATKKARFRGRYDDPAGIRLSEDQRFRVVYCGTRTASALGEIIDSSLRPDLETIEMLQAISDGEPLPCEITGCITIDWRKTYHMEVGRFSQPAPFADMQAQDMLGRLRVIPSLVRRAVKLMKKKLFTDFDRAALMGPHKFTQYLARYVYEQEGNENPPPYAGIRYVSKLHDAWECWAAYFGRVPIESIDTIYPIPADDPGLREVSKAFQMPIENDNGELIYP